MARDLHPRESRLNPAFKLLCAGAPLLAVGGCDTIYSVQRVSRLDAMPPVACVLEAIRQTPGITEAKWEFDGAGHYVPGYTARKGHGRHQYLFLDSQSERWTTLVVSENEGEPLLSQGFLTVNTPPDPVTVQRRRTLMRDIEKNLAEHCGMTPARDAVVEQCMRVACPALSDL